MKKIIIIFFCAWILQSCCPVNQLPTKNTKALVGVGLSGTKDGGSWEPKTGGLVGLETQVLSCNKNSSVYVALILLIQGAAISKYLN